MQFKNFAISPQTFRDFNGIRTHGLCVRAAVLHQAKFFEIILTHESNET